MAGSTINGNVGGAAASGAQVQCLNVLTNVTVFGAGDGSGNYTIPSLTAGTYIIRAFLSANVYYHPVQVIVDGVATFAAINLNPIALNASNAATQASNF
jgi:hypothetical protein